MKWYCIPGLGADQRVFDFLNLKSEKSVIIWIEPLPGESIADYATRLLDQVNTSEVFGIIGVSFGGLIAVEMSKQIHIQKLVLISTVITDSELSFSKRLLGKMKLIKILPKSLMLPPKFFANYYFQPKETSKKMLYDIVSKTDKSFAKWALDVLLTWENKNAPKEYLRLHGTNDKLLKLPKISKYHQIEGGSHFMIVDEAEEISGLINEFG